PPPETTVSRKSHACPEPIPPATAKSNRTLSGGAIRARPSPLASRSRSRYSHLNVSFRSPGGNTDAVTLAGVGASLSSPATGGAQAVTISATAQPRHQILTVLRRA